jgi:predicted Zn-dependent peptidase
MNPRQVVIERDPQSRVALLQFVIRTGALSDPPGLEGLASFTGRALLRGTRSRSYRELTSAIEGLGASVAVRTDQDMTVLRAAVLDRNLDPLLDLVAEILSQPAFDSDELSTLRESCEGSSGPVFRILKNSFRELACRRCTRGRPPNASRRGRSVESGESKPRTSSRFLTPGTAPPISWFR